MSGSLPNLHSFNNHTKYSFHEYTTFLLSFLAGMVVLWRPLLWMSCFHQSLVTFHCCSFSGFYGLVEVRQVRCGILWIIFSSKSRGNPSFEMYSVNSFRDQFSNTLLTANSSLEIFNVKRQYWVLYLINFHFVCLFISYFYLCVYCNTSTIVSYLYSGFYI